ncbi:hAT dimerization domain, ribonuclease H-like domain protein, partial [Tanacetum coccineum]
MVISEEWSSYREDDTAKANFVKEKIVNDEWWDKVSYILSFTGHIYDMIRACDTDKPCLHLVYEMWDSMIEKVKFEIYKKEKSPTSQRSLFYDVVKDILVARWTKNNTPLHCLAHSLNPRFYSDAWLLEDSTRNAPHRDAEISQERIFRRMISKHYDMDVVAYKCLCGFVGWLGGLKMGDMVLSNDDVALILAEVAFFGDDVAFKLHEVALFYPVIYN